MTRAQQIAKIIENRQPLVQRIEKAELQLQKLGLELQAGENSKMPR